MSHNQRQKKRNAQFKRKHFDAKGRGRPREERQHEPAPPGQQPVRKAVEQESEGKAVHESPELSRERREQTAKYSKRKVASNWDRYDNADTGEGSAHPLETEEQLQQRLVQLLNLPSVPHPLPHWEGQLDTAEPEEKADTFLALDLPLLAKALSALPTHSRLALDPDLLQCYEEGEGWDSTTDSLGSEGQPSRTEGQPNSTDPLTSRDVDLKSCLLREDTLNKLQFSFDVPDRATHSATHTHSHELRTAVQGREVTPSQPKDGQSVEDTELDTLLHLAAPPPPAAVGTPTGLVGGERDSQDPAGRGEGGGDGKPLTAELDDILDDLLT